MLAALAEATERVQIGPLVAATSFHSPAMLAKKAVTVDEISGGRLVLGLGAGWNEVEFAAFGFAYDRRASRFEEAFEIVRRLLAGDRVDHHGEFYQVEGAEIHPRGPREGGPPMMIGSIGPRVLAATLPFVTSWNAWYAWYGNSVLGARELLRTVDEHCERVGREPRSLERTLAVYLEGPGGSGRVFGDETHSGAGALTGPVGSIAEHLAALGDLGVAHVQLVIDPIDERGIDWAAAILDEF